MFDLTYQEIKFEYNRGVYRNFKEGCLLIAHQKYIIYDRKQALSLDFGEMFFLQLIFSISFLYNNNKHLSHKFTKTQPQFINVHCRPCYYFKTFS